MIVDLVVVCLLATFCLAEEWFDDFEDLFDRLDCGVDDSSLLFFRIPAMVAETFKQGILLLRPPSNTFCWHGTYVRTMV